MKSRLVRRSRRLNAVGLGLAAAVLSLAALVAFDYVHSVPLELIEQKRFAIPTEWDSTVITPKLGHRVLAPVATVVDKQGREWLDFGAVTFGAAAFALDSDTAVPLTIELRESLVLEREPANQYAIGQFEVRQKFAPGRHVISPPLRHLPRVETLPAGLEGILPFRYARIVGLPAGGAPPAVQKIEVRFPYVGSVARFESSSPELNAVWELSKQTILNTGYGGMFVDGNRERLPYEADAHINLLAQFAIVPDPRLAQATIRHLADNPSWPIEWAFEYISLVRAYWQYTGDIELLREVYPHLLLRVFPDHWDDGALSAASADGVLQLTLGATHLQPIIDWPVSERTGFVTERNPAVSALAQVLRATARQVRSAWLDALGLPTLAFYQQQKAALEWARMRRIPPDNAVVQARFLVALRELGEIAVAVGDESQAVQLREQAGKAADYLVDNFFDPATRTFRDVVGRSHSSFHSNLYALLAGVHSPGDRAAALGFLNSHRTRAGVYSAHYLLRAFYQSGRADWAFAYMTAETRRSWLGMLAAGADMTTEAWYEDLKPNMDWNHPWGASPAHHIVGGIVGLTPSAPGFAEIDLAPRPFGLKWFEYEGETLAGRLFLRYESQASEDLYRLELPARTQTVRLLPGASQAVRIRQLRDGGKAGSEWESVQDGAVVLLPGRRYDIRVLR